MGQLCNDILIQAQATLDRSKKLEEEVIQKRLNAQAKKAHERELEKMKRLEEIEKRKQQEEQKKQIRLAQIEKTKNIASNIETAPEQFAKKGHKGGDSDEEGGGKKRGRKSKKTVDDIVSDS